MAHTIIDNSVLIQNRMKTNVPLALRFMVNAIKEESTPVTPMRSGALRAGVRTNVTRDVASITWQGPYAQYQERGKRADGTHVVRKYSTPGTGKGFAEKSVRKVVRNSGRYFKMARLV